MFRRIASAAAADQTAAMLVVFNAAAAGLLFWGWTTLPHATGRVLALVGRMVGLN